MPDPIIANVEEETKKIDARKVWENLQYLNLALTIGGQALMGGFYLLAQSVWLIANIIAVARDFALKRPAADIVKDSAMLGLTAALVLLRVLGIY